MSDRLLTAVLLNLPFISAFSNNSQYRVKQSVQELGYRLNI